MANSTLQTAIDRLWGHVDWTTPRDSADPIVWETVQICHAHHRAHNPAYRARCEREGIGDTLDPAQLRLVVFPEEIWKGYSELDMPGGQKMGVFCERDAPRLVEYLNQYLAEPIPPDGLTGDYMHRTNLKGGLDKLRNDLEERLGIQLLTSSGTTGGVLSLIPVDQESRATRQRANRLTFDQLSDVPGLGPINPDTDYLVAYGPRDGSMLMAAGMKEYAANFGDRAFLTIPASVYARELRWRTGEFAGMSGKFLRVIMKPLTKLGGKVTSRKGAVNMIEALKKAEHSGRRTLVFANLWMFYSVLKRMEALLEDEVKQGLKKPGEPYVQLARGSVLVAGGGNKSGLSIPESDLIEMVHRLIGGIEQVGDGYSRSESLASAFRCQEGNYHLDPHVVWYQVDGYLSAFDPRETNRIAAQITGDVVDGIYEDACACGITTRYFKRIHRDERRGSKGCAAALREYA